MKTAIGAIGAGLIASACCLGPVAFAAIGSGAVAAASTKLAPVRPVFLGVTGVLLGFAFYHTYRAPRGGACGDGACAPGARRRGHVALWLITVLVVAIVAFPYYAEYLF